MRCQAFFSPLPPRAVVRPLRVALLALLVTGCLALLPTASAEPVRVEVALDVLTMGNYDANKGTYVLDMYVAMRWDPRTAPEGFVPDRFEFTNGRAVSKERLVDETDNETGLRQVWWRVQANLYSDPQFESFPYDTQLIEILIEDAIYPIDQLVYVPIYEDSGIEDTFHAAGWRLGTITMDVVPKMYLFEEEYSRVVFRIPLSREPFSTTIKTMLPITAFVFVSGLSFFLHPSKIAQRLGLGTSMIISAVLFHISQTVNLPPLSRLILFDKIMLSVYAFLVGSLIVTTLIAIDEDYWKERDHTKTINFVGGALTIGLPVLLFAYLYY